MPQSLYWGKSFKKPASVAAFNYVCDLFEECTKKNPLTDRSIFSLHTESALRTVIVKSLKEGKKR